MSESFEQMLEESTKTISAGMVITGEVIGVKEDEVQVNIGYKADGIISKREYTDDMSADLTKLVSIGDSIEVKVLKVNDGDGMVSLSYKRLQSERVSKVLEEAAENATVMTAKVNEIVKGGMTVLVDGTKVFIPASLASDTYEKDLNKFLDKEVEFTIIEFNPKKRRIIGDCKTILVEKKKAMKEELFSKIEAGSRITGVVKNVTDFGVFIDIGGVDGLLHISEMSWGRNEQPKNLFKAGDEVEVMVKSINEEKGKVALTRKFPETDPWVIAADKYAEGMVVKGVVARMTDFGAFVELEKGVDALLHVSQISRERIEKPSAVLSIGQEIEAQVISLDTEGHKISISMKELLDDEPVYSDSEDAE